VEDGRYRMTVEMPEKLRPVEYYLKIQGRFRHLTKEDIKVFQEKVIQEYNKLLEKVHSLRSWSELKG
jgi:pyruvate/2-oxoacid:ferredoxin oxidoreductase beta subunit